MAAPGSARAAPLSEDFDSGAAGWEATGLWRVQDHPEAVTVAPAIAGVLTSVPPGARLPAAATGTAAAWFGDPGTGTYCTGFTVVDQHPSDGCNSSAPVDGTLTSPPFTVTGAHATLGFQAWWEIGAGDFETSDLMRVEYTADGSSWTEALRLNPAGPPFGSLHQSYTSGGLRQPARWRTYVVDLPASAIRIRFRFDSVDTLGQGFRGWLVDGIGIAGTSVGAGGPGAGAPVSSPGTGGQPGTVSRPGGPPAGPVLAQTIAIEPVRGRTAYTTPGAARPSILAGRTIVPVGSILDTRRGTVRIIADDGSSGTETGSFHDGVFQIRQALGQPVVELAMRGGQFPHCDGVCTSAYRRPHIIRRLWGTSTGGFRTRGRYASGTVRGTNWVVEDRLGDTFVGVRRGSVTVRDFVRDRNIVVNAGGSYDAVAVFTNHEGSNPRFRRHYTIEIRGGRVVHVYRATLIVL